MPGESHTRLPPLIEAIRANRRGLARLITRLIENPFSAEAASLYPFTGQAHIIGITGAPGTGKSSLVNALAHHYRRAGQTVGIVAVDPTSPFSGGAILADRIRMVELSGDPGVFIRSMATRGALGGLAAATGDVVRALDAAGFEIILVETVGAGQSEVDIAQAAHTTVVVEAPGMGDDVQAIKAGILEIADILVVNKADNPGVDNTVRALRAMLDLGHRAERIAAAHHRRSLSTESNGPELPGEDSAWQTPLLQTVASSAVGISELAVQIAKHRHYLESSGTLLRRERAHLDSEIIERLGEALLARVLHTLGPAELEGVLAQVVDRNLDPAAATNLLLSRFDQRYH